VGQEAQLAIVLLPDTTAPDIEQVLAAWRAEFPQLPVPAHARSEQGRAVIDELTVGDHTVFLTHIPAPAVGAAEALATSWMWQVAPEPVRDHAAHVLVVCNGAGAAIPQALAVTRVADALVRAANGSAVFWPSAQQVHAPKVVRVFAVEELPIALWVGVTTSSDSATSPTNAATHGLAAFGYKELEVLRSRMPVGELRVALLTAVDYVLRTQTVFADGETFGLDAETHWPISHRASKLVLGRDVIVIDIP
jgi:hypothetical protein